MSQNYHILKAISSEQSGLHEVIERLYDLGLYSGLEIQILRRVSFGQITILQFDQTLLALNETEMSCLKF